MAIDISNKNFPSKELEQSSPSNADNVVLSVEGVSKKFCRNLKRAMFYAISDIAGELFGVGRRNRKLRREEFWALKDISFKLRKGDAVGLVGANGAGKTTLLKIISGLIKPDDGRVVIKGKIAPLIALGAGFNPILTGRENIYINMAILGLSKSQIDARFGEVVAFAEIENAIDAPVQTYSSGMSARLGFSCAIHTDPEILLIDEVLAVGDIKFRAKCYRKLAEFKSNGASFLLVSHSTQSLLAICQTGIFLNKGIVHSIGKIGTIINHYDNVALDEIPSDKFKANASEGLHIKDILVEAFNKNHLFYSKPGSIKFILQSDKIYEEIKLLLIFRTSSLESDYMLHLDSLKDGMIFSIHEGVNEIILTFPECNFRAGTYHLKAAIVGPNHYVYEAVEGFNVVVKNTTEDINSLFHISRHWSQTK